MTLRISLILIFTTTLFCVGHSKTPVFFYVGRTLQNTGKPEYCEDTLGLQRIISEKIKEQIWFKGHYTCVLDSFVLIKNEYHVYLSSFFPVTRLYIRTSNIPDDFLNHKINSPETINQSKHQVQDLQDLYTYLLDHFENNGYPFAELHLDSLLWLKDTLFASLHLQRNTFVTWDSVFVKGAVKITPIYLQNYIGIKSGLPYSEEKLRAIPHKIDEWSFASLKSAPEVFFTPGHATLSIPLQKKKSSNFYGIVGFLPNAEGQLIVTGEARLKLDNALTRGESIQLQWKRIQTNTQNVQVKAMYPYLLNMPIGLGFDLDLFRKDTSFSNFNAKYALNYLISAKDYIQVFLAQKRSNLLSTKTILVQSANNLDVSALHYGLGLRLERLNYNLNPSKGYFLELSGAIGNKNILKNPRLNSEIYDSLALKTQDITARLNVQYYITLKGPFILKTALLSQYLWNKNLFQNEFFRIGGLFTLRGFDEESIYASSYGIFTLEPRFILEKNAFLYLFLDAAYYENKTKTRFIYGYPYSFGAGISFETKPGIFTFSYALGRMIFYENGILKDNGFSLRSGKVHFGFITYF